MALKLHSDTGPLIRQGLKMKKSCRLHCALVAHTP